MNTQQLEGITKARLSSNLSRVNGSDPLFDTDEEYISFVIAAAKLEELPESAADSYAEQFKDVTVTELEVKLAEAIMNKPEPTGNSKSSAPDPIPTVNSVPQRVSRFQARAALYNADLLGTIEAYMASPDVDPIVKLAWEDAQEFRRTSPTVASLSTLLGLNSEALDALFIAAAKIEA